MDKNLDSNSDSKDKSDWPEDPSAEHLRQWIAELPKQYVLLDFDKDGPKMYYLDPNDRIVSARARCGNSGRQYEFRDDAHFWPLESQEKILMRGWTVQHDKGRVPHKR